jgi:predicted Zn-dependent protease
MIKDGKIAHAVKNMVFREKPVYLLLQKEVLGVPERVYPKGFDFPMLVPPLRVKDVLYSGPSGII